MVAAVLSRSAMRRVAILSVCGILFFFLQKITLALYPRGTGATVYNDFLHAGC